MFCPNCGTKNEDEALFCGNCGTRLVIDVPQETPVQESVPAEPEATSAQENVPAEPETTPEQESAPAEPEATPEQERAPAEPESAPVQESVPVQPQQTFGQQPVQPAQFTGQTFGQQPVNNKPARFPKGIIAIVAAGVAVIAAIIIFVCVGKNVTDYKKTAKQYVKAVAECEWNDAYSLINLPDGEFLKKHLLMFMQMRLVRKLKRWQQMTLSQHIARCLVTRLLRLDI